MSLSSASVSVMDWRGGMSVEIDAATNGLVSRGQSPLHAVDWALPSSFLRSRSFTVFASAFG